jgi:hypothetical protein
LNNILPKMPHFLIRIYQDFEYVLKLQIEFRVIRKGDLLAVRT